MTRPDARVRIVVEQLVLDGLEVPPGQVDQLVAAMREQLYRLALDTPATWAGPARSLQAPAVELARNAVPAEIGQVLGGALHGALAPRRATP